MQRAFAEALSNLQSLVVRFNENSNNGRLLLSPRAATSPPLTASESFLYHICGIDLQVRWIP